MTTTREAAVRRHWKSLLAVLVAAAIGNLAFEPDWNDIQQAADADAFRRLIDPTSTTAAALCDLVFAACYGVLGVVGLRVHGRGTRPATAGAVTVAVGAISDEIENVLLLVNVARRDDVTDGWIDAMQVPGTVKWVAALGVVLLYAYLIRLARERRRTQRAS